MFDKFKQMKEIQKLQKELKEEKAEAEKSGVKVTVNGNMEVEDIQLNSELDQDAQAKAVKEAVNDAMKQIQKVAAQKMQGMGGGFGM
jgi:DNA-binding protein YbaB